MTNEITIKDIQEKIIHLENRPPFMLGQDLAEIYEVETKQINRAVRRNPDRFPEDFCFRLTRDEADFLRCQNGTFKENQPIKHLPWGFTRMGCNQLSTVLKSKVSAERSVQIMRVFSKLEEAVQCDPTGLKAAMDDFDQNLKARTENQMLISKDEYIELLRQSNAFLSGFHKQHMRLTERQKKMIVNFHRLWYPEHHIAQIMGVSHQAVENVVRDARLDFLQNRKELGHAE